MPSRILVATRQGLFAPGQETFYEAAVMLAVALK